MEDIEEALKLAREIVNGGNGQAHTYFQLFRNAKKVSYSLIACREPVKIQLPERSANAYCACGQVLDRANQYQIRFCPGCGRPLMWR